MIIAYAHDGVVHMAGDTITGGGGYRIYCEVENRIRIHRFDNGVIVGATGALKMVQAVFARPKLFAFDEAEGLTKRFLVKNVIPELFKLADANSCYDKEDNVMDGMIFLVVWKDIIFEICPDFSINTYRDYTIAGNNSAMIDYAVSRIDAGGDIDAQLIDALRLGAKLLKAVEPPFVVIDTKEQKFTIAEV